ncbi:MAG TPA: fatty acid desaturase [Terriglobales bacterium]|nr:fatty acid desaturase [Terriglobales bacterium]
MAENATRSEIIDAATLRRLSERSDRLGLMQLAAHVALLLATGLLVYHAQETIWLLPAMILHGVVLIFLFTPLHECIHRTAFASRRLNDGIGFVLGTLLLLPREYFRLFHFAHHRFTQDPARDPELAYPKPQTLRQWLRHVSGLPYWIGQSRLVIAQASGKAEGDFFGNDRQRQDVIREARLILALYAIVLVASLILRSDAALIYWVLPAILGQPFLRVYLLAEHALCPETSDMLENTRTTYTNGLVRFLAWNMPYHIEHHAFPAVPFHALPQLNAVIADKLKTTAPGYVEVQRQILRSFKNG